MISGRNLLKLDRYFWLSHKVTEWILLHLTVQPSPSVDHTFVIKLMGMGSIVRFASLCDQHNIDKNKMTLITFWHQREVCELWGFPHLHFIRVTSFFQFLKDILGLFSKLRAYNASLIIDLERGSHAVSTLRLLLALWGNCSSLSFEPGRSLKIKRLIIHPADRISLKQLFSLGIEKITKTSVETRVAQRVAVCTKKVLINVNASDLLPARRYPLPLYADLIRSLHQRDPLLEFYLTGSGSESAYVKQLTEQVKEIPVYHCAGAWPLRQLIKELSECALFITGDSGPLHLAIHLGAPTLTIWGPTQAAHFGYENVHQLNSLTLGLHCSPCFTLPGSKPAVHCKGRIDCLVQLSPIRVAEEALLMLGRVQPQRLVNFPPSWEKQ